MDFSVQNLSNNENEPCIYLSLQSNNVLLDCSLQRFSKKLFKTPNFTQQISKEIDFVLITNYNHLLALPFLTEFTDFNGKIFATEPVAEFGKLMMLELVTLMKEEQNPVFFEGKFTSFYDVHDVESCVSKIKRLHFSENLQFNDKISFTPLSSGFSLGSSNWIINYLNLQVRVSTISEHSISYMSNSSFSEFGHASAFEQNLLNNNDYFIFNNISVNDGQSRIKKTLEQICSATSKTIQDKGNVIFPISPFGYAYDLINLISTQLETIGFGHIPIHVVSPVAKFSFHMANIFGEWMNKNLQNNLYFSKKPLKYGNLIENGLLHFHEEASTIFANFQGPFIIFITHPSLELGEAGILLQELRYHRASSIQIITIKI
ncbi:Integrator complex subunit 9 [Lobulomyces angularis]|nr:Integrator complex subunit 9 [Lobulomyces angularis]